MHTRPRKTGEAFSGLWTAGGFDKDPMGTTFENPFEKEDTYGTQFEFMCKDGITARDIRNWVRNCAEWARLPVIYREFDENGSEVFNEDYGDKTFKSTYEDDNYIISLETEYFSAYCAPGAKGRTLLLDSPIERNYNVRTDLPWSIDIRLKNENGVVVSGPNKGLEPVEDDEYDNLEPDQRENLVPKSQLISDDLTLPSPTGTRDTLSRHSSFWTWLSDQLMQKYKKKIAEEIDGLSLDNPSDFQELDSGKQNFIMEAIGSSALPNRPQRIANELQGHYGATVSVETIKTLDDLQERIKVVDRENYRYSSRSSASDTKREHLWEVLPEDDDAKVFMGCKLSPKKVKVVHKDSDANKVVSLYSSDEYEEYEEKFGWRRLTDIGPSTIDEFNIPAELAAEFQRDTSSKGSKQDLTIYYGDLNEDEPKRMTPNELEGALKNGITKYNLSTLVVFPRADDRNVSDNKHLANTRIAVASCTKSQWEKLEGSEGVKRAEKYWQEARDLNVATTSGIVRAGDLDFSEVLLHPVSSDAIQNFRDPEVLSQLEEYVQTQITYRYGGRGARFPDATYVPVTLSELDKLRPLFKVDADNREDKTSVLVGDYGYDLGRGQSISNDIRLYAYARLPEWQNTEEMDALQETDIRLDDGGFQLVETLVSAYEAGIKPESLSFEV